MYLVTSHASTLPYIYIYILYPKQLLVLKENSRVELEFHLIFHYYLR